MGAKVDLFTTSYCPFCVRAKSILEKKGATFTEHNLDNKPEELKALKEKTGWRTVPQIFINDDFIGGCQDMEALDFEGKLDGLLAQDPE